MQTRRIHEVAGQATWVMVLETGDEAIDCLTRFAGEAGLDAASFTAIGAFERATLAFFDWELKEYLPIPVEEQVEVASLSGDIALGPASRQCMCMRCWDAATAARSQAISRPAWCGRRWNWC